MKAKVELLEILAEADKDVRNGRVAPIHDTFNNLRSILKEKQSSKDFSKNLLKKLVLFTYNEGVKRR